MAAMQELIPLAKARFPGVPLPEQQGKEFRWQVASELYPSIAAFLAARDEAGYVQFCTLTAVDRGECFELVLVALNLERGERVVVTTQLRGGREPVARSVTDLWPGADWAEREAAELFGIQFKGHPNQSRLLLDDDFVGYPLRKDFSPEGGPA